MKREKTNSYPQDCYSIEYPEVHRFLNILLKQQDQIAVLSCKERYI